MPPQAAPKAYRLTKFGGKCRARFPKSSFKKKFNIRGVKNVKISIKNILISINNTLMIRNKSVIILSNLRVLIKPFIVTHLFCEGSEQLCILKKKLCLYRLQIEKYPTKLTVAYVGIF